MRRRRFLAAALLALTPLSVGAAAIDARQGLLWRIDGRGKPASWLFGTLHLPDHRLLPLPDPVAAALRDSRRCLIEMLGDEQAAARFAEAGLREDGGRLDALLSVPAYGRLMAELAGRGVPEAIAERLKPWAALLIVTAAPPVADAHSLDSEVVWRARQAGLRVEDLDSVEEQIAVFDDIPIAVQLALLEAALEHESELRAAASASVDAWLRRDLAGLRRLGRILEVHRPSLAGPLRVLEKKIIVDRSVVMAYRMQWYLRQGATFVAVGASHLYGRQGIPSLLAQEYGWRLRRVW